MSLFTDPGLKVNFVDGDGTAILLEPIRYEIGAKGSADWLTVPVGFKTDGASVPRPLWAIMPPWGSKVSKAAIVHDFLIDELRAGRAPASVPNRAAADREFALALRALGVASARVSILYAAVRGYGAVFA